MKIQLFVTPALGGGNSIIRYRDGVYDRIPVSSRDCQNVKGFPVDQKWARSVQKNAMLMNANKYWYGVSEDAELYEEDEK